MKRLIDAEKLNAEFDEIINFLENDTKAKETISKEDACECIKALRECVDDQPTAYDVEKVVEQLEEEREHSYADFCDYLINYELDNVFEVDDDWFYKGLIRAEQIVRKGGVE